MLHALRKASIFCPFRKALSALLVAGGFGEFSRCFTRVALLAPDYAARVRVNQAFVGKLLNLWDILVKNEGYPAKRPDLRIDLKRFEARRRPIKTLDQSRHAHG